MKNQTSFFHTEMPIYLCQKYLKKNKMYPYHESSKIRYTRSKWHWYRNTKSVEVWVLFKAKYWEAHGMNNSIKELGLNLDVLSRSQSSITLWRHMGQYFNMINGQFFVGHCASGRANMCSSSTWLDLIHLINLLPSESESGTSSSSEVDGAKASVRMNTAKVCFDMILF